MFVIYVEDDLEDFMLLSDIFREIDPESECVNVLNGRNLLNLLEEDGVRPDVIIMDINMPIMDGKSALKAVKADARFQEIPVYIYSTGIESRDVRQCLELGATGVLVKPNTVGEMETFLRALVMKHNKDFKSIL